MCNTERDELAQDIRNLGITVIDGPPVDLSEPLAQHLHNLGYRKPRTITTTEELDAAVERAARVLVEVGRWGVPWEDATYKDRKEMLELARTVLTAAITED